jgi:hypothetical protein
MFIILLDIGVLAGVPLVGLGALELLALYNLILHLAASCKLF